MSKLREIRESFEKKLDHWEASATEFEVNCNTQQDRHWQGLNPQENIERSIGEVQIRSD